MDKYAKSTEPFETGARVEYGNYMCCQCSHYVIQDHPDGAKLPECPKCGRAQWIKF